MATPANASSFSKPCPYAFKGCQAKIDDYDSTGHIAECQFNDGGVNLDDYFKTIAAEHNAMREKCEAANKLAEERRDFYERPYRLMAKYDPATGRPLQTTNRIHAYEFPAPSPTTLFDGPMADTDNSDEDTKMVTTLVSLQSRVKTQFDHLKVQQGPRSGARLLHEAMNLLFRAYDKPEIPL